MVESKGSDECFIPEYNRLHSPLRGRHAGETSYHLPPRSLSVKTPPARSCRGSLRSGSPCSAISAAAWPSESSRETYPIDRASSSDHQRRALSETPQTTW